MDRPVLAFFLFSPIAFSQSRVELGVRVDAPLIGPLTTYSFPELCWTGAQCGYYQSEPLHPAMGLSFSIAISRGLRLRFDPVYQRIGLSATTYALEYQSTVNSPLGEVVIETSATANRWQFPALLEANLLRHLRFGVGPAVSLLTGAEAMGKRVDPFFGTSTFPDLYTFPMSREVITGAAAALEFPFRCRNIILAPELRYKRWFDKHYGGHSTMDEFTAGVAIRFSR